MSLFIWSAGPTHPLPQVVLTRGGGRAQRRHRFRSNAERQSANLSFKVTSSKVLSPRRLPAQPKSNSLSLWESVRVRDEVMLITAFWCVDALLSCRCRNSYHHIVDPYKPVPTPQ